MVGDPPDRSLIVKIRAQAMDAALARAGVAIMDMAYAKPYLATRRLRALDSAVTLPEGYYFVKKDAQKARSKAIRRLEAWLVGQAFR